MIFSTRFLSFFHFLNHSLFVVTSLEYHLYLILIVSLYFNRFCLYLLPAYKGVKTAYVCSFCTLGVSDTKKDGQLPTSTLLSFYWTSSHSSGERGVQLLQCLGLEQLCSIVFLVRSFLLHGGHSHWLGGLNLHRVFYLFDITHFLVLVISQLCIECFKDFVWFYPALNF